MIDLIFEHLETGQRIRYSVLQKNTVKSRIITFKSSFRYIVYSLPFHRDFCSYIDIGLNYNELQTLIDLITRADMNEDFKLVILTDLEAIRDKDVYRFSNRILFYKNTGSGIIRYRAITEHEFAVVIRNKLNVRYNIFSSNKRNVIVKAIRESELDLVDKHRYIHAINGLEGV